MRCAMWESAVAKFELSAARHCKGGKRSMPRVLWLHRSEEHTSELQSRLQLVCRLLLETKDERNGLLSVLWFNLAHYALRPWPWILTALVAVCFFSGGGKAERGSHWLGARANTPALLCD